MVLSSGLPGFGLLGVGMAAAAGAALLDDCLEMSMLGISLAVLVGCFFGGWMLVENLS